MNRSDCDAPLVCYFCGMVTWKCTLFWHDIKRGNILKPGTKSWSDVYNKIKCRDKSALEIIVGIFAGTIAQVVVRKVFMFWEQYRGRFIARNTHTTVKPYNNSSGFSDQYAVFPQIMMTSWHGGAFRIAVPLWGNPPVDSPLKGSVMQSFDISFVDSWTTCWTNVWVAGD